jgi:hypothetical protein
MVRAAPNMAHVVARIRDIRETKEPKILLVNLHVLSSEPVSGYEDFVSSRFVGKTMEAKLLSEGINISEDHVVELLVTYKGDEHGGSFYAQRWSGE